MRVQTKKDRRTRIRLRQRQRIDGTAERPRLAVTRSLTHISAQVIDDLAGQTLASASSTEPGIKAKFQDLTQRFLSTLASNRRLMALPAIIQQFEEEMASRRGEITAEVITAHALTDAQTKALKASIKDAIGKDAMLNVQENKEIIGGLIVKVGSVMMDDSVKTKLDRLNRRLKQGTHQSQTKEEVA